jgi:hypothetical protein
MYEINTEKILFTQLGEEGVIYDMDRNEYLTLNETYFKILKGVEEGQSTMAIVQTLCTEYRISEQECLVEVEEALTALNAKEIILKA